MLPHPLQLEILDFSAYRMIVDARSPREFAEDHIPGAVNLPVVDDDQYAQVGTRHRDNPHDAYMVGVEHALRNIAAQLPKFADFSPQDKILVYCFRGGKRSKLWADALKTIGFQVDVLRGGWKSYRRWVNASLSSLPPQLQLVVIAGKTGTGKTRFLHALRALGEQVVDLEEMAGHRGSLIGAIPDTAQPLQKQFDSALLQVLRTLDPSRPIWMEDESKKIGNIQLPESLHNAMQFATHIEIDAPMPERVLLWKQDYPHLVADPLEMVRKLTLIRPLVGGQEFEAWKSLAHAGDVDSLFERVMTAHYDPCYARTAKREHKTEPLRLNLHKLSPEQLSAAAKEAIALSRLRDSTSSKANEPAPH